MAPDGKEKTVLPGCKTGSGLYIAYKVVLPTAIVKGTEDAELDAERDSLAKEWNGKVTLANCASKPATRSTRFHHPRQTGEGEGRSDHPRAWNTSPKSRSTWWR